jgi:bifunctional NMN adenylyltransferase/nudix hydrolase
MFGGDPERRNAFRCALPASTLACLAGFQESAHFPVLADELACIEAFRESWSRAPYPPILVTTDALVVQSHHVLLVRRGHAPGKGLWALPGGFVDQDETLLDGCVRELREESGLALSTGEVQHTLRACRVFDAPHRSLRGRTITHAFRFDLPGGDLPRVAGGDDAADAAWVARAQLERMEPQMFEDHFHIARCMLR